MIDTEKLDFVGYENIPLHTQAELKRWVENGYYPGSFLSAVLCNDLFGAINRADYENLKMIPAIVQFIYNRVPSECWGNAAIMREYSRTFHNT